MVQPDTTRGRPREVIQERAGSTERRAQERTRLTEVRAHLDRENDYLAREKGHRLREREYLDREKKYLGDRHTLAGSASGDEELEGLAPNLYQRAGANSSYLMQYLAAKVRSMQYLASGQGSPDYGNLQMTQPKVAPPERSQPQPPAYQRPIRIRSRPNYLDDFEFRVEDD